MNDDELLDSRRHLMTRPSSRIPALIALAFSVLAGCGNDPFPRTVPFESLYAQAAQITISVPPARNTPFGIDTRVRP